MRKSIAALLFAAVGAFATPVFAITGNWVDDHEHPFVGLVVFYDAAGQFIWRCSGSLITPTKFVTAGHCADTAEGAASARVYFQQDAGAHFDPATGRDPITGYPETCAPGTLGTLCATSSRLFNYGFANFAGFPNTRDVGLSGGPVFLGDASSNLIVAVTSFGLNALCRGTDFAYRLDQVDVLNWINSH
jgi:secreted trypsin-like serine protease